MDKVLICTPEEMNQLQYREDIKMRFAERLKLAFDTLSFPKHY